MKKELLHKIHQNMLVILSSFSVIFIDMCSQLYKGKKYTSSIRFLKNFLLFIKLIGCYTILIQLSGCQSIFYTPNAQNVPLFTEKKEANISGALQISNYSTGVDIQIAASVTNHIGLIFNFNHWAGSWEGTEFLISGNKFYGSHKCNFGEMGVGYYLPIKNKFVFETYGGIGIGKVVNENDLSQDTKIKYNRYFLQPAIGFYHKNIKLIFSTRFCGLDFRDIYYSGSNYNLDEEIIYAENNPFSFLIEPAFTFRGGWKYFKFQIQVGRSFIVNNPYLNYDPLNLNLGLMITIPAIGDPVESN